MGITPARKNAGRSGSLLAACAVALVSACAQQEADRTPAAEAPTLGVLESVYDRAKWEWVKNADARMLLKHRQLAKCFLDPQPPMDLNEPGLRVTRASRTIGAARYDTLTPHFHFGEEILASGCLKKEPGQRHLFLKIFLKHLRQGNKSGYCCPVIMFLDQESSVYIQKLSKNFHLSQQRAESVVQYLAVNHKIPLRRFITPLGYGKTEAVADNTSAAGRAQNRRVEVKMLVNRGISRVTPTNRP